MHELLARWQRGWSRSRGWTNYTETDHVIAVQIGEPDRQVEYFTTDQYAEGAARMTLAAPHPPGSARLAVITPDPVRVAEALHPLKIVRTLWLMSTPLADHPQHPIPPEYELHQTTSAGLIHAELRHHGPRNPGRVAATGRIAIDGTDAVADMIRTEPAHRRRGLAQALMSTLTTQAQLQGATTGLLLASPEGHLLYTSLHWTPQHQLVFATT
ncbi:GNAT family N-acetyltransferase [Kribbella sp. NPDC058245]|uniref:GNAT family N-acetyltransferase n=1 Tax=Kribbella sp. NPDC058245 TaxID=3346399 RepID=UPI0036E9F7A4